MDKQNNSNGGKYFQVKLIKVILDPVNIGRKKRGIVSLREY